jgi:hypothetical protein
VIQLKILTGKKAGAAWVARRFPVQLGRGPAADCRLEEDGVWDEHAVLQFQPSEGVVLTSSEHAVTRVNGNPTESAVLRNGDIIECGSAKVQFWLSETRQLGLRFREYLTWSAIAAISLGQVALVYWLLWE